MSLLSVVSLISYFYKDAKHDVPEGHFMESAGILAIVLILITVRRSSIVSLPGKICQS